MSRTWILPAGIGTLLLAGVAVAGTVGPAVARITVLDDDAPAISRAIAPRADGSPGLRLDDGLIQLPSTPSVLAASRQVARVSGGAATATAPSLLGRGPEGMAELLRDRVVRSGGHRVFVDDIGPAFAGDEGDDLAVALAILSKERTSYAPTGLGRRVHLYVSSTGPLLADPAWAGARLAAARSGGVWLETTGWDATRWLAWPAEAEAQLAASGSIRQRVHVVFGAGPQPVAWALGRAGSACEVLGNGPGGYRLGASVDDFVAQYRRTLPITAVSKVPVVGCTAVPAVTAAGARGLASAVARETSGLEIPPGGLLTPPLPAGEPAQLTLQLGADPLGLAAALGVSPEAFWNAAGVRLEVRGPGVSQDVTVEGDGAARIEFTPATTGPVTMRLVLGQQGVARALDGAPDLVTALRAAGADATLIRRVVADPSGWSLSIPLQQPGQAPGSPVLQIVAPPQ